MLGFENIFGVAEGCVVRQTGIRSSHIGPRPHLDGCKSAMILAHGRSIRHLEMEACSVIVSPLPGLSDFRRTIPTVYTVG